MSLSRQPVALGAAVLAVAQATPAVLVGLGVVHWTSGQIGLVEGYVGLVSVLVATVVHGLVTPVADPRLPYLVPPQQQFPPQWRAPEPTHPSQHPDLHVPNQEN